MRFFYFYFKIIIDKMTGFAETIDIASKRGGVIKKYIEEI